MGRIAQQRQKMREALHRAFCVSATYKDNSLAAPAPLSVRWHNKTLNLQGLDGSGYAELVGGGERAIFNRDELAEAGITLQPGGVITITEPGYNNVRLILAADEPIVGPVEEIWQVAL